MHSSTVTGGKFLAAPAVVLLLLSAAPASAQDPWEPRNPSHEYPDFGNEALVSVDVRGGPTLPAGQVGAMLKLGSSWGGSATAHLTRWLGVRADFDVDVMPGGTDSAGVRYPGMTVTRLQAGVEANFLQQRTDYLPLTSTFALTGGLAWMDADNDFGDVPAAAFHHLYAGFTGRVNVGYQATEKVNLFVAPEATVVFANSNDTAVFAARSGAVDSFDAAWLFPLRAGVRVTLP